MDQLIKAQSIGAVAGSMELAIDQINSAISYINDVLPETDSDLDYDKLMQMRSTLHGMLLSADGIRKKSGLLRDKMWPKAESV